MATTEWKSDFVESFVNVGIEKGLSGPEQGIVEGAIRAKAEDILKVLDARLLKPTKEQRGQVNAATDLAQLDRWFDRALTAATAAEILRGLDAGSTRTRSVRQRPAGAGPGQVG